MLHSPHRNSSQTHHHHHHHSNKHLTNNNLSVYIASTCVVNSTPFFGAFQDAAVGSSELTIRTIVPPNISTKPYRKAMIAILFYRRILSLSSSPSVSIRDLTTNLSAYFTLLTDSAKSEAEHIVDSTCHAFPTLIIFKAVGCSITPVHQRWYRIYRIARRTLYFLPFDLLSRRAMSTIAFLRQLYYLIFR